MRQKARGIDVKHASSGDVEITNKGTIQGKRYGIYADHVGTGDVVITNKSLVRGETSQGMRVFFHTGVGDVEITNKRICYPGKRVFMALQAIHSRHRRYWNY